ncbi:hypothetical protein AZH51_01030 [Branchiibius sp. NY16-3462-2]|nr:hypothetical protein AZH51_01030 [Branchiibius sp. NY16-3462-2]
MTICGRLVADPERRQTAKGDLATMRVAVNERKKDPDGGYSDGKSSFYTVSAWGELGREVMECLHKGNGVVVHGTLRVNSYPSDGRTVERVEVTAEHVGPDLRFGTAFYRPRQWGGRSADNAAPDAQNGRSQWAGQQPGEPSESETGYSGSYDVVGDEAGQGDTGDQEALSA